MRCRKKYFLYRSQHIFKNLQGVSKICLFTDRFELHWINQSVDYVSKEGKRPSTSLKIGGVNFGSGTEVDGISIVDVSESVQLRDLRSGSVFVFRKYRYVSRSSMGSWEETPPLFAMCRQQI